MRLAIIIPIALINIAECEIQESEWLISNDMFELNLDGRSILQTNSLDSIESNDQYKKISKNGYLN